MDFYEDSFIYCFNSFHSSFPMLKYHQKQEEETV